MNSRTSCLVNETSCLFSPTTLLKAPENTKNYGLLQRKALQPMRGQFSCIGQQIMKKQDVQDSRTQNILVKRTHCSRAAKGILTGDFAGKGPMLRSLLCSKAEEYPEGPQTVLNKSWLIVIDILLYQLFQVSIFIILFLFFSIPLYHFFIVILQLV